MMAAANCRRGRLLLCSCATVRAGEKRCTDVPAKCPYPSVLARPCCGACSAAAWARQHTWIALAEWLLASIYHLPSRGWRDLPYIVAMVGVIWDGPASYGGLTSDNPEASSQTSMALLPCSSERCGIGGATHVCGIGLGPCRPRVSVGAFPALALEARSPHSIKGRNKGAFCSCFTTMACFPHICPIAAHHVGPVYTDETPARHAFHLIVPRVLPPRAMGASAQGKLLRRQAIAVW